MVKFGVRRVLPLGLALGIAFIAVALTIMAASYLSDVSAAGTNHYVEGATGSDSGNCANPADPCQTIEYALTKAATNDNVLVAQGLYIENLFINHKVNLVGGYESAGWTRDVKTNLTTIDGRESHFSKGDWDGSSVWAMTVISDAGSYKMWYTGAGLVEGNQIGYATSSDGISWTKNPANPVLTHGGNSAWDEVEVGQPFVLKDGGTYKMWYWGLDEDDIKQIGYATSTDGITWLKHAGPVLPVGAGGTWDSNEVGGPSVYYDGGTYHMWYHGQDGPCCDNLQIGYASSPDGINWTKHISPVLSWGNGGDWDADYVGVGSVISQTGEYHMYYWGRSAGGLTASGLATSTNGIDWHKYAGNPVLTTGSGGTWDEIFASWTAVSPDGKKLWYRGRGNSLFNVNQIGYATSVDDGITWNKNGSNPVLTPGTAGNWGEPVVYYGPNSDGSLLDGFTIQNGYVGEGGGIRLLNAAVSIRNNRVISNQAYYVGGGFLIEESNAIIQGNQILTNTAGDEGGGIFVNSNTSTTIFDNEIAYNRVVNDLNGRGAGVRTAGGSAIVFIKGNDIHDNVLWGGGSGLDIGTPAIIEANDIHHNDADDWGGAIVVADSVQPVTLTNNVIYKNQLDGLSGVNFRDLRLINNTFDANEGGGVGLFAWPLTPTYAFTATMVNNIIANSGYCGIYGFNGVSIYTDYNDVYGPNADYCDLAEPPSGAHNLSVDPKFIDPSNGDYRLQSGSPVIDQGTSSGAPAEDRDGNTRPIGNGFDIGAFEWAMRLFVPNLVVQSGP